MGVACCGEQLTGSKGPLMGQSQKHGQVPGLPSKPGTPMGAPHKGSGVLRCDRVPSLAIRARANSDFFSFNINHQYQVSHFSVFS